jgi:hypothetical protein
MQHLAFIPPLAKYKGNAVFVAEYSARAGRAGAGQFDAVLGAMMQDGGEQERTRESGKKK